MPHGNMAMSTLHRFPTPPKICILAHRVNDFAMAVATSFFGHTQIYG